MSKVDEEVKEMRELMDKTDPLLSEKEPFLTRINPFKKSRKDITSNIYELTYGHPEPFSEQELAERRAFIDGYEAGRKDGSSKEAYRLWKKMRDSE